MRRNTQLFLLAFSLALLLPCRGFAAHNPADYPLRVHIFRHNSVSHYAGPEAETLDNVDGEGRANLYENSQPRAFDFHYECEGRLMNSISFETLPARWKKPNRELEVLQPLSGKTCRFRVDMKDGVAFRVFRHHLIEVPADQFKAWMDRHQYDPEHGKNIPIGFGPSDKSEMPQ